MYYYHRFGPRGHQAVLGSERRRSRADGGGEEARAAGRGVGGGADAEDKAKEEDYELLRGVVNFRVFDLNLDQ